MRSLLLLLPIGVIGWAGTALLAYLTGMSVGSALVGAAIGIAWMVFVSIVLNTRQRARDEYEIVWGGMDGLELHNEHMRRDRVHRHSENATSIPVGEPS
jgi:hypothetical protein